MTGSKMNHHQIGLVVIVERLHVVQKRAAIDGIATDADTGGNANAQDAHLI
ncbi:hypothetical protein N9383_05770 [Granulosicoccus sp.]|nr:hypothetical protein [Granulosicoccus sp.]